jgi:hypothetical protein
MTNEQLRQKLKEKLSRVNARMESKASEKANQMGLDYMSFGRWGKNGKVTHKSKDGKLVALSPADASKATSTEPSDPNQMIGTGKNQVNPAPDRILKKQTTGTNEYEVKHRDAARQLPGMMKKLIKDNPGSSVSIEPGPDGFKLRVVPVEKGKPKKVTVDVGPVSIDPKDGTATMDGQPLMLSKTESKLLTYLAGNQNKIIPRGTLLDKVWDAAPDIQTRTVDMHIARLKKRLGKAGGMLQNVRGMGYRIVPPRQ